MTDFDTSLLGKCGYYCGCCPSYAAGKCPGCEKGNADGVCYSRDCAISRKLHACGECADFPCERIITDRKATLLGGEWLVWKRKEREK